MKYLNQLEYEAMPYPTNVKEPESTLAAEGNIALAGCGICSAAMMLEQLLSGDYSLEEIRDLAVSCKANLDPGTDMKVLGQELCCRYGLVLHMSDRTEDLLECLQTGGRVIINVGGDREGHTGVFSHGGHYILAVDCQDNTVTILDSSWKKDKFDEPDRKGKVTVHYPFCLCSTEILNEDTANRSPAYYCFKRRTDGTETEA